MPKVSSKSQSAKPGWWSPEEHDDGGLVPGVQLFYEPAQILVRALDGRQKLVHLGAFHLVRFQVYRIGGGHEPRVVAAVVLDGDVEDELGPVSLIDLLQHALVGGAVRHEIAEGVGVLHGGNVVEVVESELLVDAVAPPVGCLGRVNRVGAVPQTAEVGGEVVHPFQIVEHIGVHARRPCCRGGAVRNSNSLLQVPPPMADTYTSPAARESSATSWKNVGAAFVPSRPG